MITKSKECSVCHKICKLWKSTPKLCKDCAGKIKANEAILTPSEPRKPISPISDKMKGDLALYRKKRDEYFKEHQVCEYPGCHNKKITLHHKRGKIGKLLTDERYFCSLCLKHHIEVNENPDEALKMGLVGSRLANVELLQEKDLKKIAEKGIAYN